ncbi:hypothetical protein US8_00295 [Bacillus altitudinis]|nr:hypothetical protein US8_00295 [Bacillus altitudinis]
MYDFLHSHERVGLWIPLFKAKQKWSIDQGYKKKRPKGRF